MLIFDHAKNIYSVIEFTFRCENVECISAVLIVELFMLSSQKLVYTGYVHVIDPSMFTGWTIIYRDALWL